VSLIDAKDDAKVKLPVGMHLIGPKYSESLLLNVAGSWERANDWKMVLGDPIKEESSV
jgi:Asp-tRNA(Asn)/Glu-tRNA(Gln) amidotransferase A subunit family amidase